MWYTPHCKFTAAWEVEWVQLLPPLQEILSLCPSRSKLPQVNKPRSTVQLHGQPIDEG